MRLGVASEVVVYFLAWITSVLWSDTKKSYEELEEKPLERIQAISIQCVPIIIVLLILAYCTFDASTLLSIMFLGLAFMVGAFEAYVLSQDIPRVMNSRR